MHRTLPPAVLISGDFMKKNILLHVSGSISAYKSCALISLLKKHGYNVRVIATKSALKFVGKASFEGLSHNKLETKMFNNYDPIPHINLAQNWADLIISYPCSANTINRLAAGLADDLFGAVCLANNFAKPLLVAPAMNTQMFHHPSVQENLKKLESWGAKILPAESGLLACGTTGDGRLISPEKAFDFIEEYFTECKNQEVNMKILITGGGTCEPIDTVRYITNFSTGRTAAFLADFFCKKGADVTALMAENAQKPKDARIITYRTFSDLQKLLESECKNSNYGAIIHAAAVSDYSVQEICVDGKIFPGGAISKIPSGKEILLKMQENPKLLYKIKQWSGNSTKLAAFKLTSGASEEEQQNAVKKIFLAQKDFAPDFVVQNEKSRISGDLHPCKIFKNSDRIIAETQTLQELAETLNRALEDRL